MTDRNVTLLVAAYGNDTGAAAEDFEAIKSLGAGGTTVGAVAGLVVGLFAPPLLQ